MSNSESEDIVPSWFWQGVLGLMLAIGVCVYGFFLAASVIAG